MAMMTEKNTLRACAMKLRVYMFGKRVETPWTIPSSALGQLRSDDL